MSRPAVALFATLWLFALPAVAGPIDPDHGKLLHETFCVECHGESVAKRETRIAKSYEELRRQVVRWQSNSGLKWDPQDIDDVTAYLNATYYKFKCPDC
jgi:mono/diheme cytochrome c family protein